MGEIMMAVNNDSPQQPETDYIITAFQLKQLQEHADLDFVCQAIKSKPLRSDQLVIATFRNLQNWRMRAMTGTLKKDVYKIWNEETDKIAEVLSGGE